MKTKLTFLLSLTFLFLFSGSVYGGVIDETIDGVFDRKGKGVGLYCRNWKNYILVNMKDKNIKLYHAIDRELQNTYKITKETGVYIMGENEKKTLQFIIDRHTYFDKNILFVSILAIDKDGKVGKDMHTECIVGDKVF